MEGKQVMSEVNRVWLLRKRPIGEITDDVLSFEEESLNDILTILYGQTQDKVTDKPLLGINSINSRSYISTKEEINGI
jgi:hypothetical protein